MPANRWPEIEALFEEALRRPASEREAFITESCGDDAELKTELFSLLDSEFAVPEHFMRPPIAHTLPVSVPSTEPSIRVGGWIGRYRIKSVIASGGMGTVCLAEQDQPRRDVALKVLRGGSTSRSAMRRFHFEAEVLAKLHHPHIAQIYEAGIHGDELPGSTGAPYFAMEFVPAAATIDAYARSNRLEDAKRLELFIKVCDAVQYGHQQGFIHRDLKPGNILVDANGHLKLIDFGVAKVTDKDQAATMMQTEVGQLIGTLQYMSPEQCTPQPGGIDTRADVYALGVVLYELLTGRHPYDVSNMTIHAVARTICEQAPTRPSIFKRSLKGDLDTILLKCLQKEPAQRYPSAGHLADDLRRYLNGRPIEARPPTRWQNVYRWLISHPKLVTSVACMIMVVGTTAGTWLGHYFVSRRPHNIVQVDKQTVHLTTAAGMQLYEWKTRSSGRVSALHDRLIDRPKSLGGGRLAFLCFPGAVDSPYANKAFLFDVDKRLAEPETIFSIEPGEPLPDRGNRGYNPEDFGVMTGAACDFFSRTEGLELCVIHQHQDYSEKIVRIYDLAGHVQYQIWYDGSLAQVHWLTESKLLVFRGNNAEVLSPERGIADAVHQHPLVLFAIRPSLDTKKTAFLHTTPGQGPLDPAWYRQLKPDNARDLVDSWAISEYGPRVGVPGRSFRIVVHVDDDRIARVSWDVDEFGNEIPGSREISDSYKANRIEYQKGHEGRLIEPDLFQLGDLTPIR